MSTTITALFDTRAEAEAAKGRLQSARVEADHVHIHDKSSDGFNDQGYSTHQDLGFWGSIRNAFVPDEDRHTYEEGVRRGGALLTADVDDDCVDEAVKVLESANTVDIDDRSGQWRESGWNHPGAAAAAATGTSAFGFERTGTDTTGTTAGAQEEVIPIVEEQLVVGKRDVSRGGVRVRSYVTETPVHEQIRLRNERVNVERRKVDQPLSAADGDAFRERTVSMTATGEEAMVAKTARVVEEVVVSKSADEHVEQIDDTVRKTEVDVDETGTTDRGMGLGTTTVAEQDWSLVRMQSAHRAPRHFPAANQDWRSFMQDPMIGGTSAAAKLPGGSPPEVAVTGARPAEVPAGQVAPTASSLAGQARQKLAGALDSQKGAAADLVERLAQSVGRSGEQFQGQQDWIASAVGRGAAELNTVAGALRDMDLGELVGEVQSFARRQPALFTGAALAAGLAVARLGKVIAGDLSRDDLPTMPGVGNGQN